MNYRYVSQWNPSRSWKNSVEPAASKIAKKQHFFSVLAYLEVYAKLEYPCLFDFKIVYQSDRLQVPTMEVKARSMHEQLRVELGKFGKFQSIEMFEILSQIRKGGGYQVT